jgi:hypothetical protein
MLNIGKAILKRRENKGIQLEGLPMLQNKAGGIVARA